MYEDKKLPSKMRTFRFNDAMEGDLAFLMELWSCTATEAMTRALSNSAVLERAFAIQRPASGIHSPTAPLFRAASNNTEQPTPAADEQPTAVPEYTIKTQTAAQIEKPAPSAPITKESPASAPTSAAGDSAASVPTTTKGGNKVVWQFKIYLKNDPHYSIHPGTPSGKTAEIAIAKAKIWLREHGLPDDLDLYFPAGTHCKTIKI